MRHSLVQPRSARSGTGRSVFLIHRSRSRSVTVDARLPKHRPMPPMRFPSIPSVNNTAAGQQDGGHKHYLSRNDGHRFSRQTGKAFALSPNRHAHRIQGQGQRCDPDQRQAVWIQILKPDIIQIGQPRQNEHQGKQAQDGSGGQSKSKGPAVRLKRRRECEHHFQDPGGAIGNRTWQVQGPGNRPAACVPDLRHVR